MIDFRVEPIRLMKTLNEGDNYIDSDGNTMIVTGVTKDEDGNVIAVSSVMVTEAQS